MSGECSFFNFCLRGRDSLVSKWISQKRKIPETLKTDGANIYAISEYIHTVFYFDKLYGSDYSCNVLFNKIIAINELDKNYNELLCQHKKIHRFKVYKLYSLFVFQFIALEGFIHFIRYTVI